MVSARRREKARGTYASLSLQTIAARMERFVGRGLLPPSFILHFRDLSRKKNKAGEARTPRSAESVLAYAEGVRGQVPKHAEVIFSRHTG